VRSAGGSDALVQDVGATMRSLVTHARRLRWLTAQSQDPMWMVRYARTSTIQGAASVYVPRSTLPTDDQCDALFAALEEHGHARWALAMRLVTRTGLRWGELVALQAGDIDFNPRIVHVRRAVEQGSSGPAAVKTPKNGKTRTAIYPRSLEPALRDLVADTVHHHGSTGLLLPNRAGGFARRSSFQPIWVRAADAAGWPMTAPLRRSAGYGQKNKGWRWTGAAEWTPHDLRHVAAWLDALRPRPRPRRRRRQTRPRRPGVHHPPLHRHPRQPRHRRHVPYRSVVNRPGDRQEAFSTRFSGPTSCTGLGRSAPSPFDGGVQRCPVWLRSTRRRSWALRATTTVEALMSTAPRAMGSTNPAHARAPAARGMAAML
jgi:integrase